MNTSHDMILSRGLHPDDWIEWSWQALFKADEKCRFLTLSVWSPQIENVQPRRLEANTIHSTKRATVVPGELASVTLPLPRVVEPVVYLSVKTLQVLPPQGEDQRDLGFIIVSVNLTADRLYD